MLELNLARLQIALFLTSLDTTKMLDLATTIRDSSNGLLDADPLMLPIPSDAPLEFPRLILKSSDGRWTYQVFGNRLDFIFELPPDALGASEFCEIIKRQAYIGSTVWDAIQPKFSASGNRIGVVSLFAGSPEDSVQILRSRFMLPSDAPKPHVLQLHTLHRTALGSITVNRWTRCMAGEFIIAETKRRDLLRVEIDINTIPEQRFSLTSAKIISFAEDVRGLVLATLASLFEDSPSGERIF
jgi:hypothetical protein